VGCTPGGIEAEEEERDGDLNPALCFPVDEVLPFPYLPSILRTPFTLYPLSKGTVMKSAARVLGVISAALLIGLLIAGCGGKKTVTPAPVGEMQDYRDPQYGFHLQFPKGWANSSEAGKTRIYNSLEGGQRFVAPTDNLPDGAMISVDVVKTPTPASSKDSILAELKNPGYTILQEGTTTVDGKPATSVVYTAAYSKTSKLQQMHVIVLLDTLFYKISYGGFGDQYALNQLVFEAVTKSFQFPVPVEKGRDQTLPSTMFTDYDAKLFSLQYPENFNFVDVAKGNNELALNLRGVRQDCSIQFIVFGAKGLTVEKVVAQNKAKFPGSSEGKATINGLPAITLSLTAAKDVERRVYFVVKNDKVYRIIMDWYKPQREEYLAAYDKVLQSIKIK
jgi:hypothetical protein